MNVFLLNGPPGSGKDTIGNVIADLIVEKTGIKNTVCLSKFAAPLDAIAQECLDGVIPFSEFHEWREKRKEENFPGFNTTMRNLLITISEDLIKPQFGSDYFGKVAARDTIDTFENEPEEHIIFTDSGFQCEYDAFMLMIDEYNENRVDGVLGGKINVHLIQIHRDGHTFEGDSREWVRNFAGVTHEFFNNGGLDDLPRVVDHMLLGIGAL